ncbi:MBL fold metallo-hydrolase, partial [Desulfobacterales bacterium HSG17]|nr:MBL fold metallo-hydrolase [Desulfobacterales bacterium HSG17]
MDSINITDNDAFDPDKPIKIADRIWWVGHYLNDDPFQCHIYLIENKKNSVLIDPGSKLTFKYALRKIEQIIPFNYIRYFVCHHQDPDITGSLPLISQLVTRDDAVIVSHWRAIALLKHYGIDIPFLCVEKNNWHLNINDRLLKFIFTPYLHFPGAYCTFDVESGILFSSDLFGGFTDNWTLIAQDESYFESIRPFHEHYMPSREILYNALVKLERYPINLVAPQHGSIIPKHLIKFMFNRLKDLDCGLYLMTQTNTDIIRLSNLNRLLQNFIKTVIIHREFGEVANALSMHANEILPVQNLLFYAMRKDGKIIQFDEESMYRGIISDLPEECEDIIGMNQNQWNAHYSNDYLKIISDSSNENHEYTEQSHKI